MPLGEPLDGSIGHEIRCSGSMLLSIFWILNSKTFCVGFYGGLRQPVDLQFFFGNTV